MDSWQGISSQHSHQRRPSQSQFPPNFAQLFDELFRGSLHCWLFEQRLLRSVDRGGPRRVNVYERFLQYAFGFQEKG